MHRSRIALGVTLACLPVSAAIGQGETQRQHDADRRAQSTVDTKYHNNANDYPSKSTAPATPPTSTRGYHDYRFDQPIYNTATPSAPPPPPRPDEPVSYDMPAYVRNNYDRMHVHMERADKGVIAEMLWVAVMSYDGVTVQQKWGMEEVQPKDRGLSYKYYRMAGASQPYYEYMAAQLLYAGDGVPQDRDEAIRMMRHATGCQCAINWLNNARIPLAEVVATAPIAQAATTVPASAASVATSAPAAPAAASVVPSSTSSPPPINAQTPKETVGSATTASPSKGNPFVKPLFRETVVTHGLVFAPGSPQIGPAGSAEVMQLAAFLSATSGRYEIAAHTDNSGAAFLNLKLSQQRADAVKLALSAAGVDPARLVAKGYGSSKPVASNSQARGQFSNRRIELNPID